MASIIEKRRCLHKHVAKQQTENENLKEQLNHLQALSNIGVVTCMIAHEINNLLTPLSNYAILALNNPDDKALTDKALEKTVRNCKHTFQYIRVVHLLKLLKKANQHAKTRS